MIASFFVGWLLQKRIQEDKHAKEINLVLWAQQHAVPPQTPSDVIHELFDSIKRNDEPEDEDYTPIDPPKTPTDEAHPLDPRFKRTMHYSPEAVELQSFDNRKPQF